jgi:hypothetical protein
MHEDTIHDLMIMHWHHDYVSLCIFKKQICKLEFPTLCFLPFPRHQCCQQECHCKFSCTSCTHSCRTMSMRLSRWLLGGRSFCHRVENRTCRCARFLRIATTRFWPGGLLMQLIWCWCCVLHKWLGWLITFIRLGFKMLLRLRYGLSRVIFDTLLMLRYGFC